MAPFSKFEENVSLLNAAFQQGDKNEISTFYIGWKTDDNGHSTSRATSDFEDHSLIENIMIFTEPTEAFCLENLTHGPTGDNNEHRRRNILKAMYATRLGLQTILNHHVKYDYIVVARADLKCRIPDMTHFLNAGHVSVSNKKHFGYISDWFFVGQPNDIFNCFDYKDFSILNDKVAQGRTSEEFLMNMAQGNGVTFKECETHDKELFGLERE